MISQIVVKEGVDVQMDLRFRRVKVKTEGMIGADGRWVTYTKRLRVYYNIKNY